MEKICFCFYVASSFWKYPEYLITIRHNQLGLHILLLTEFPQPYMKCSMCRILLQQLPSYKLLNINENKQLQILFQPRLEYVHSYMHQGCVCSQSIKWNLDLIVTSSYKYGFYFENSINLAFLSMDCNRYWKGQFLVFEFWQLITWYFFSGILYTFTNTSKYLVWDKSWLELLPYKC